MRELPASVCNRLGYIHNYTHTLSHAQIVYSKNMTTHQTPREAAKKALQEFYENETSENMTRFVDTLEPLLEHEIRTLRAEVVWELVGEGCAQHDADYVRCIKPTLILF